MAAASTLWSSDFSFPLWFSTLIFVCAILQRVKDLPAKRPTAFQYLSIRGLSHSLGSPSFLFRTQKSDYLVKAAAEAAITEVVGGLSVDEVLTVGKLKIQNQTQKIAQELLDDYGCGIRILTANLQEIHPHKDVINAHADMDKFVSEAHAYKNIVVPKARGEAVALIKSAEAYKENVINQALENSTRFLAGLKEYQKAPKVNRDRLYLKTMERIGPIIKKYIIFL